MNYNQKILNNYVNNDKYNSYNNYNNYQANNNYNATEFQPNNYNYMNFNNSNNSNNNNNFENFKNSSTNQNNNYNQQQNQEKIFRITDFNNKSPEFSNESENSYIKYLISAGAIISILIFIIIGVNKFNNNDTSTMSTNNLIKSSTTLQANNTDNQVEDNLDTLDTSLTDTELTNTTIVDGAQSENNDSETTTTSSNSKSSNKSNISSQANNNVNSNSNLNTSTNTTTTANTSNANKTKPTTSTSNTSNNNTTSTNNTVSNTTTSEQTGTVDNSNQIRDSVNNTPVSKNITVYPVNGVFYPLIKGTPNAIATGVLRYHDASGALVSKPWSIQINSSGEGTTTIYLPSGIHQYEFVITKTVLKGSVNAEVVSYLYSFEV